MKKLAFHPLSFLYPELSDNEKAELRASIEKVGLLEPITLYEGKILDGRHRYEQCVAIGGNRLRQIKMVQYKGTDPLGFIDAKNAKRRHLTSAQKAVIAAKEAEWRTAHAKKTGNGDSRIQTNQAHSAERHNVSVDSVQVAAKVLKTAEPEVSEKVSKGEMSLRAAEKAMKGKAKEYIYDETGFDLPENMLPLWERRGEVMSMLREIAEIRNKLFAFQKEKDILYATLNFSDALMALDRAHQEIKLAQLWALCTSCQGHQPQRCSLCKGRGILSKFAWDTFVPEEIKRMRKGRK